MELQQSRLYAEYMRRLHWAVYTVDGVNVFIRTFPILGGMVKIHRSETLPRVSALIPILERHRVRTIVCEPAPTISENLTDWLKHFPKRYRINRSPFLPTKTSTIDLTPTQEIIFSRFSEAKRRAVRKAEKNGVSVRESRSIFELVRIKSASAGLLGFLTTAGLKEMWEVFAPGQAAILIAESIPSAKPVAGVLLVFWERTCYYWIAGSLKAGKKNYAPTLLVWRSLQFAKARGASVFDFVGVWDERLPRYGKSWLGFTKFKTGFGGKPLYYPIPDFLSLPT